LAQIEDQYRQAERVFLDARQATRRYRAVHRQPDVIVSLNGKAFLGKKCEDSELQRLNAAEADAGRRRAEALKARADALQRFGRIR
jgi:hypothetical protein